MRRKRNAGTGMSRRSCCGGGCASTSTSVRKTFRSCWRDLERGNEALEYNGGMASVEMRSAVLTAHPSTPNDTVRSLAAQLRAEEPDILVFQYSLVADMSRVRVPLSGAGGRADALWEHTCF